MQKQMMGKNVNESESIDGPNTKWLAYFPTAWIGKKPH